MAYFESTHVVSEIVREAPKGEAITDIVARARASVGRITADAFEAWVSQITFLAQDTQMMGPKEFGECEDLMIDEGRVLLALLHGKVNAKKHPGTASFIASSKKQPVFQEAAKRGGRAARKLSRKAVRA